MSSALTKQSKCTRVSRSDDIDHRYRAVFDAVTDGIFISNSVSGQFVEVNQSGCQMFGCQKDDIIDRDIGMLSSGIHPYTQEVAIDRFRRACSGEAQTFEWQCRTRNGHLFWAEVTIRYIEIGPRPTIVANVRDITERREQSARFRQLAENIAEVFWMSNLDMTETLYVSPGYEAITGHPYQSLYENPGHWLEIIHEDDRERIAEQSNSAQTSVYDTSGADFSGFDEEYRIVRPDGEVRWVSDRTFPVRDDSGKIYRIAGVVRDITERKRLSAELEFKAHHDALTGLANRFMLKTALDRAVAQSGRNGKPCAVLFLDLDHFKEVNDTRGHPFGDRLLCLVAERLQAAVRVNEGAFRLGGDEFAILLSDPGEPAEIAALADRVIASLSSPFTLDGDVVHIGTSIGVGIYGADTLDADALMSHADMALYRAKAQGRQTCRFYCGAPDSLLVDETNVDRCKVTADAGVTSNQPSPFANGRICGSGTISAE